MMEEQIQKKVKRSTIEEALMAYEQEQNQQNIQQQSQTQQNKVFGNSIAQSQQMQNIQQSSMYTALNAPKKFGSRFSTIPIQQPLDQQYELFKQQINLNTPFQQNYLTSMSFQSYQQPNLSIFQPQQVKQVVANNLTSSLIQRAEQVKKDQTNQQMEQFMNQQNLNDANKVPQDLHDYIQRAFSKCLNIHERKLMDSFLKKIINSAKQLNLLNRDWKNFDLPLLPRERTINLNIDQDTNAIPQVSLQEKNNLQNSLKVIQQLKKINKQQQIMQQQQLTEVPPSVQEQQKRSERLDRFKVAEKVQTRKQQSLNNFNYQNLLLDNQELDFELMCKKMKVIGICQSLEKNYLRLTELPDPSTVRPEKILKQSLKMVLNKWKNKKAEYPYVIEQFQSIRQDLTVQHIRNKFSVKVYENNGRISLECHDIQQFNQCQSKLIELYQEGLKGNRYEFMSYRILYQTLNDSKYELSRLLTTLDQSDLNHEYIKYALQLRENIELGNIYKVFNMYKNSPNMSQYLLDVFIYKLRVWALSIICKSFGEIIEINYLTDLLAFNETEYLISFLNENGAIISPDSQYLKLKDSYSKFTNNPSIQQKNYDEKQK